MVGWTADCLRFAWGLIYWNVRKSQFRLGGARGPAPCQSPSDSGKALQTECDACKTWHRPQRFQRVCPLLVQTSRGLRCAADTAEVRPFWGRALRYAGVASGCAYLAATLGVYAYLKGIGYRVRPVDIVWPPHWSRIASAQSGFFLEQSHRAFDQGQTQAGLLALANAYEADPGNYAAAIETAMNNETGNPLAADKIFARTLATHPEHNAETAWAWFRCLLAREDYRQIRALASSELGLDTAHAGQWMRALVTSSRRLASPVALEAVQRNPRMAAWQPLLSAEIAFEDGRLDAYRAQLRQPWPDSTPPYGVSYRLSHLIDEGQTFEALDDLERMGKRLDPTDRILIRLKGLAVVGTTLRREREIRTLFDGALSLPLVEVVAAHLIAYPDSQSLHAVYTTLSSKSPDITAASAPAWLALFCAAGVARDRPLLDAMGARLRASPLEPGRVIAGTRDFFLGETAERKIATLLPYLPLDIEVEYALLLQPTPVVPTSP